MFAIINKLCLLSFYKLWLKTSVSGLGFVWSSEEDEWRQSVAPIPPEKLVQLSSNAYNYVDSCYLDASTSSAARDLQPESENSDSNGSDDEHHKNIDFEREVSFLHHYTIIYFGLNKFVPF